MQRQLIFLTRFAALLLAVPLLLAGADALAQTANPLGVPVQSPPASPRGAGDMSYLTQLLAWVYQQQQAFQLALTDAVKSLRAGGAGLWALLALSFGYGVFHAAGPGHGKAVLSSYMLANEVVVRRGVALAFAAAALQALVAIALIFVLAIALNTTGQNITGTSRYLELGSYALVVALGLWLVWAKIVRRFLPGRAGGHAHGHNHDHAHDDNCGHSHTPDPEDLSGRLTLSKAAGLVVAMGLRPCTGAIVVLLFALAQGVLWAGVAATFAMAAGTGLAVAFLAALALGSKKLATWLLGAGGNRVGIVHSTLEGAGALLVLLLGLVLFAAGLSAGRPF